VLLLGLVAGVGAGALLALGVLLLRRPVALAVLRPILEGAITRAYRVLLASFGPVGVAAIYYALHATEKTGETLISEAASLVVATSVLAHGVTSGPGLRAYGRRAG